MKTVSSVSCAIKCRFKVLNMLIASLNFEYFFSISSDTLLLLLIISMQCTFLHVYIFTSQNIYLENKQSGTQENFNMHQKNSLIFHLLGIESYSLNRNYKFVESKYFCPIFVETIKQFVKSRFLKLGLDCIFI